MRVEKTDIVTRTRLENLGDGFYEVRAVYSGTGGTRERCMGTILRKGHGKWSALPWISDGDGGPAPEFARRSFSTRRDARHWLEEHQFS